MVFKLVWIRETLPYLMDDIEDDSATTIALEEAANIEGTPLLIYKNYKYNKTETDVGGKIHWQCVNPKCQAFVNTEGLPGQRTIAESNLNHYHTPHNDVQERRRSFQALGKRKLIKDSFELKKSAAETSSSNALPKEKRFFGAISLAGRKYYKTEETIGAESSANTETKVENKSDSETSHSDSSNAKYENHHIQSYSFPKMDELKVRDEFDLSGWMFGNQLRALDHHQRYIAEKLVADIIFKARLRMLSVESRIE